MNIEEWREHIDGRLDAQDKLLKEIGASLQTFNDTVGASKMGLAAIKWLVGIGAGIAAIWGVFTYIPPK